MEFTPLLQGLIGGLRCLPGVGPKSAQRMAFHLLERDREGGMRLAQALQAAMEGVQRCKQCRMFSEQALCEFCRSEKRDKTRVCVVESPADVIAVEQGTEYRGRYFVLMGHLSPIDGIGPEELGLEQLRERLAEPDMEEVIIATNSTVEGEATAHYITGLARAEGVAVSRIAHGVPVGGELEYVDGGTLAHAFSGRRPVE